MKERVSSRRVINERKKWRKKEDTKILIAPLFLVVFSLSNSLNLKANEAQLVAVG
jgi:hypothetical protein